MKSKKTVGIIAAAVVVLAILGIGLFIGIHTSLGERAHFYGDGYFVETENSADTGEITVKQIRFSQGSDLTVKYPDSVEFSDAQGTKTTLGQDNFVFYDDGSISALKDGILLNGDSAGGGLVNYYYLEAKMVLQNDGGTYTIDNNDSQLTFDSFVWKLSDEKYLVYSNSLGLTSAGEKLDDLTGGWLQVEYLTDYVVTITDGTQVWQKTTTGGYIEMASGLTVNLQDKEIDDADGNALLYFEDMEISADSAIELNSGSGNDWVAPTFNFTVKNGEDGDDGDDGNEGEAGTAGESGENGTNGGTGKTGSAGSSGGSGGTGGTGSSATSSTLPSIRLTNLDYDCAKLKAIVFEWVGNSDVLTNTGSVRVYRTSDNSVVYPEDLDSDGSLSISEGFDDEDEDEGIAVLTPDTEYRLVVSCGYSLGENNEGTKEFLSRTFTTSSIGTVMELDYATDSALYLKVDNRSYSEMNQGKFRYSYVDENGETVEGEVGPFTLTPGQEYDRSLLDISQSIPSDTAVTVEFWATSVQGEDFATDGSDKNARLINSDVYKTLKKTPKFDKVNVSTNSNYLALSLQGLVDEDNAATSYRYEIYNATTGLDGKPFKTITSATTAPAALYTSELEYNSTYLVKGYVVYFDNYVTAEYTAETTTFSTYSAGNPIVSFVAADSGDVDTWLGDLGVDADSVGFNYVYGTVKVELNATDVDTDFATHPLTLMIESGGDWSSVETLKSLDYFDQDTLYIPVAEYGLKHSSTYRISVYGWVNDGTGTYSNTYLGNCAVSLNAPNPLYASAEELDQDQLEGNSFGARITLMDNLTEGGNKYSDGDISVEMACLSAITVGLYSGDQLLSTAVINPVTDNDAYDSAICETFKRNGTYDVTSGDFNVNDPTGDLTIKILTGYDYTYALADRTENWASDIYENMNGAYQNEIPIVGSDGEAVTVEVHLQKSAPAMPDWDDAVKVSLITNSSVGDYTTKVSKNKDLADNTVVGFKAAAVYDNSGNLAQYVDYYIVSAYDYEYFQNDESLLGRYYYDLIDYLESSDAKANCKFGYGKVRLSVTSGMGSLDPLTVLFVDGTTTSGKKLANDCVVNDSTVEIPTYKSGDSSNTIYLDDSTGKWGRGLHYYVIYRAVLTLTMNETNTEGTFIYPNSVTSVYTPGKLLKSQLVSIPKEEPTITCWLDRTTTSTATWNYTISDPDGTVSKYPSITDVSSDYQDRKNNIGKPLIMAGTTSALDSLNFTRYTDTDFTVLTTSGDTDARSPAWIAFDDGNPYTEALNNGRGTYYSGTVRIGDDNASAEAADRGNYLYKIANAENYYMCLRRLLYIDGRVSEGSGFVDKNVGTTELWANEYQKFGGHLFDTFSDENLQSGLSYLGNGITEGTNYLYVSYKATENVLKHLMAFRVTVTDTTTGVSSVTTTGYDYVSDDGTVTVSLDMTKLSGLTVKLGTEYKVECRAIYDTGISGLGEEFTSITVDDPSDYQRAYLNGDLDDGYAISTLTGQNYANTFTTNSGGMYPTFTGSVSSSGVKKVFTIRSVNDAGTYTVNNVAGTVQLDKQIELKDYSSSDGWPMDGTGYTPYAYLNLVYTSSGAKIYQNGTLGSTNPCPVFKQLKLTDTGLASEQMQTVSIDAIYPTITYIANYTGYPSFGTEKLNLQTKSTEEICSNYMPYLFCEIYKQIEVEDGETTVKKYERLENQASYFDASQTVTIGGTDYAVPTLAIQSGTSSYSINMSKLEYGQKYQIRWYLLPQDLSGLKTSGSANGNALSALSRNSDGTTDLNLKNLYVLNHGTVQTMRDGTNSGSTNATETIDFSTDKDYPDGGYGLQDVNAVAFTFTTAEDLVLTGDSLNYNVSDYGDSYRTLDLNFSTSKYFDYFIKMELYDGNGTLVYGHNALMLAAGYLPYASADATQPVASGDTATIAAAPDDNTLYVWKLGNSTYTYGATNSLSFKGLDIQSDVTYTLKLTVIYNPVVENGVLKHDPAYSEKENAEFTYSFRRSDRQVSPIYSLSVSSELTGDNSVSLSIRHRVVDSTYRIYNPSNTGLYSIQVWDTAANSKIYEKTGLKTNQSVQTITLTSKANNIQTSHEYEIKILSPLDGDNSAERKSVTRETVDSSGMIIDEDSATLVYQDSNNLQLLMKNSSGLDNITQVAYTVWPQDASDANPFSYTQTASFTSLSENNSTPVMVLQTSTYFSSYAKGDTFNVIISFKKGSTTVKTITLPVMKTTG